MLLHINLIKNIARKALEDAFAEEEEEEVEEDIAETSEGEGKISGHMLNYTV